MAKMLRDSATNFYGCCNAHRHRDRATKPGRKERHQARAVEKRAVCREIRETT